MSNAASLSLIRPIRLLVIAKYLGQLMLLLACLSIFPALFSVLTREAESAYRYGLIISLILIIAIPLARLPEPKLIERNEALTISALLFLIAPLLMSYPLMAEGLSWIDAWFEAVSGMTTTGLTTIASVESHSHAFLFSRAWMQWYGGLGIAVLAVALMMGHKITSKRLVETIGEETLTTTTRTYARQVLLVYLGLTLFGICLIWLVQGDLFIAMIHSLAAVSTGGFSGFNLSLANMTFSSQLTITLLSLAGAMSLPLYYQAFIKRHPTILFDDEVRALFGLLLLNSMILALMLYLSNGSTLLSSLKDSLLLVISAQSTAGFSHIDLTTITNPALLLLMMAMLIGGTTGSTAGGVKIIRLLIVLKLIQSTFHRINSPPRAVLQPRLGAEPIDAEATSNILVLLGLWFMFLFGSWFVFLIFDESPLASLFEVVSAMSTVGLSTGITRESLSPLLKLILCFDMLLGRLEIITFLILFYPRTWISRRQTS